MKFIVFFDSAPAVGKSTLMRAMAPLIEEDYGYTVWINGHPWKEGVDEPIIEAVKTGTKDALWKLYGPEAYKYYDEAIQFNYDRVEADKDVYKDDTESDDIVIDLRERSNGSAAAVFLPSQHYNLTTNFPDHAPDWTYWERHQQTLLDSIPQKESPVHVSVVYLRDDPDNVWAKLQKRGTPNEADLMSRGLSDELCAIHEQLFEVVDRGEKVPGLDRVYPRMNRKLVLDVNDKPPKRLAHEVIRKLSLDWCVEPVKGYLRIVLEGTPGSGKTTTCLDLAPRIAKHFGKEEAIVLSGYKGYEKCSNEVFIDDDSEQEENEDSFLYKLFGIERSKYSHMELDICDIIMKEEMTLLCKYPYDPKAKRMLVSITERSAGSAIGMFVPWHHYNNDEKTDWKYWKFSQTGKLSLYKGVEAMFQNQSLKVCYLSDTKESAWSKILARRRAAELRYLDKEKSDKFVENHNIFFHEDTDSCDDRVLSVLRVYSHADDVMKVSVAGRTKEEVCDEVFNSLMTSSKN